MLKVAVEHKKSPGHGHRDFSTTGSSIIQLCFSKDQQHLLGYTVLLYVYYIQPWYAMSHSHLWFMVATIHNITIPAFA